MSLYEYRPFIKIEKAYPWQLKSELYRGFGTRCLWQSADEWEQISSVNRANNPWHVAEYHG